MPDESKQPDFVRFVPIDSPRHKRADVPHDFITWKPLDLGQRTADTLKRKIQVGGPDEPPLVIGARATRTTETTQSGRIYETTTIPGAVIIRNPSEKTLESCQDFGGITIDNGKVKTAAVGEAIASKSVAENAVAAALEPIRGDTTHPEEHIIQAESLIQKTIREPGAIDDISKKIKSLRLPELLEKALLEKLDKGQIGATTLIVAERSLKKLHIAQLGDGGWIVLNQNEIIKQGGYFKPGRPPQISARKPNTNIRNEIATDEADFMPGSIAFVFTDGLLKGAHKTIESLSQRALELLKQGRNVNEIAKILTEESNGSDDALIIGFEA